MSVNYERILMKSREQLTGDDLKRFDKHTKSLGSLDNFLSWMNQVINKLGLYDSIILDVGCGWGEHALVLAQFNKKVYALDKVDYVKKVIESFKVKNLKFILGDAVNILLKDNSVDIVYVNEAISHISDVEGALKEFKRVLKKGGEIVILDSNRHTLAGLKTMNVVMPKIDREEYAPMRAKALGEVFPKNYPKKILNTLAINLQGWTIKDIKTKWGTSFKPKFKWVSPNSGNFEENLFTPQEIINLLRKHGFEAKEVIVQPMPKKYGWPLIGKLFYWLECSGKYYVVGESK